MELFFFKSPKSGLHLIFPYDMVREKKVMRITERIPKSEIVLNTSRVVLLSP